jgi:hypothetical protein
MRLMRLAAPPKRASSILIEATLGPLSAGRQKSCFIADSAMEPQ